MIISLTLSTYPDRQNKTCLCIFPPILPFLQTSRLEDLVGAFGAGGRLRFLQQGADHFLQGLAGRQWEEVWTGELGPDQIPPSF